MSNSLRLCHVALFALLALLAAAAATCPSATVNLYDAKTSNCTNVKACMDTLCVCVGGTTTSVSGQCNKPNTTCAIATGCIRLYVSCVNSAVVAANTSDITTCKSWAQDMNGIALALAGSTKYTASNLYSSCQAFGCSALNATTYDWSSCDVDYRRLCLSPVSATLRLTLKGNWAAVINNSTAAKIIKKSLEDDLTTAFGNPTYVDSMTVATQRREAGDLIVVFVVSMDKTAAAQVVSAGALSLPSTQSAFTASGGTGFSVTTPTVDGVTPAPSTGAAGVAAIASALVAVLLALLF